MKKFNKTKIIKLLANLQFAISLLFIIGLVVAIYAVARNLNIIKIILNLSERFNT